MKASELIQKLQEQISNHGDIDVCLDIDYEVIEDFKVKFENFNGDEDAEGDYFISITNE